MEKQLIKKILVNTKELIHSDSFLKKHRLNNGFTRQGKLSFTDIMYFILSRENKSISINISNMRRFFPQLKIPPVSKQAISKARQKVSSDACLELCHLFSELYYKQKKKQSLWHGYHIYAIDGSIQKVSQGIVLAAPANIDIASELKHNIETNGDEEIFAWVTRYNHRGDF